MSPKRERRQAGQTWRCEACQKALIGAETIEGKVMPLDLEPDRVNGEWMLFRQAGEHHTRSGVVTCRRATGAHLLWLREIDYPLRSTHFATCTEPERFRRPRAAA